MKNYIIRIKVLGKLKRHGDYLHLEKMNQHISGSMFRSLQWVSKGFIENETVRDMRMY